MDQTDNKNTVESRNIWITSDQDQVIFGFNIKTSLITKFKVLEPMLTERGLFRIMEPVTTGYYICEGKKKHTIFMSNDECKTVQWHDIVNGIILDHEWFSLMSHENVIQFNINLFDEAKIKTIGPYYVEDVNRFFCRTNESDIAQTSIPMLAYKLILVVMIMIILVIIVYFCWAINPCGCCNMLHWDDEKTKRVLYDRNELPTNKTISVKRHTSWKHGSKPTILDIDGLPVLDNNFRRNSIKTNRNDPWPPGEAKRPVISKMEGSNISKKSKSQPMMILTKDSKCNPSTLGSKIIAPLTSTLGKRTRSNRVQSLSRRKSSANSSPKLSVSKIARLSSNNLHNRKNSSKVGSVRQRKKSPDSSIKKKTKKDKEKEKSKIHLSKKPSRATSKKTSKVRGKKK